MDRTTRPDNLTTSLGERFMIRDTINGIFTRHEIGRLCWPIAWQGTVVAADRTAEESALSDLARECMEAFDEAIGDPDGIPVAVEIVNGRIKHVIFEAEE
jgi:hypothetical protein